MKRAWKKTPSLLNMALEPFSVCSLHPFSICCFKIKGERIKYTRVKPKLVASENRPGLKRKFVLLTIHFRGGDLLLVAGRALGGSPHLVSS